MSQQQQQQQQQHCPMEVCESPTRASLAEACVSNSTPPLPSSPSVLQPPVSTPRGRLCRLRSAAGSSLVHKVPVLSMPSPVTPPAPVAAASATRTSSSGSAAVGDFGGGGDGSGFELPQIREQANQFFRLLADERQMLSRRFCRNNPLRTAPAKILGPSQQQQQPGLQIEPETAINRVLTFDDDDDQNLMSDKLAINNNKKPAASTASDALLMPPPPPPRSQQQQQQQSTSQHSVQATSEQLLWSVRSSQACLYRQYRQSGPLSRLSGANINRCTPEGRRRLSCGGSGSSSSGGGGGSSGNSNWGRIVDERLVNSDRLFKEFDLTDEANTRPLASGSFGYVFSAINRLDGCVYCIKTAQTAKLRDGPTAQTQAREAIQEVWAMASLTERHPNILSYYGCWVQFDRLYIQLEFCNGLCLASYLAGEGEDNQRLYLPQHRQLQLASEIGSALHYMHSEGLAHLDCSTGNLLLKAPRTNLPPNISPSIRRSTISRLAESRLERLVFKLGDFGHAGDWRDVDNLEDGTGRFMPMDALDLTEHPDTRLVDNFSLGLCLIESAGKRVPASTDSVIDGPDRFRLLETGHIDKPDNMDQFLYGLVLQLLRPDPLKRLSLDSMLASLAAAALRI